MQTTQSTVAAQSPLLTRTGYANYVLGALTVCYVLNTMDRSQILAASLQAIKKEFGASDFQMGVLTGIPFAFFYSFMGIPIAAMADRSNRRNVLALAVASWSAMTAIFGMSVNYAMLFAARVGTAVGEAGGSPPSHSLISDYFPKSRRGTAFSIFALGVPIGTSLGAALGGWGNQTIGWRMTFILAGVPGIVIALILWLTVKEPPRGMSDGVTRGAGERAPVPGMFDVLRTLMRKKSFRHLTLAAALHSVVWYASGAFNNAFLQRSHQMSVSEAGYWIAVLSAHRRLRHVLRRLPVGSTQRSVQGPPVVPVGAGHRHAAVRAVSVSRVSVSRSRGGAAVVRRSHVHGRRVLRAVVCHDAGARHAAHALGRDVAAAVHPDAHRQRFRAVDDGPDQRSAPRRRSTRTHFAMRWS